MARRPGAASSADRHHREHPPVGVLHRQAVLPGLRARPAGPAGAARVRDAAAPGDEPGAGAARPLSGRPVLGRALQRPAGALGYPAARSFLLPGVRPRRRRRRGRRPERARHRLLPRVAGPVRGVPLPALGSVDVAGVHLELRLAIEPWHVLGEEVTGAAPRATWTPPSSVRSRSPGRSGPARGHLQRLPVPLARARAAGAWSPGSGTGPGRRPRPCTPHRGALAAGVRRRRPLERRAVGGCTYHVVHRGAGPTRPSRSTQARPSRAAAPDSSPGATRRGRGRRRMAGFRHAPVPGDVADRGDHGRRR